MAIATLDDVRAMFDLDAKFTKDDPALAMALNSAIESVQWHTGRTFDATTTSAARIFSGGATHVLIDDAQTVTLVESSPDHSTWTTVAAADWWLNPENKTPKTSVVALSKFPDYVRVTGTWGFGPVPAAVKHATVLMAVKLFKRRESPNGLAFGGEFGPVRISRYEDPDVVRLLENHVRVDRVMGLA